MDAISASHLSFIRLKLASGQAISAFKFSISAKVYWKHSWQRWYLIWPKNDSMSIWYTCPPLLNTPSMGVIDNNENRKAKEQTASTVRSLLYSLKWLKSQTTTQIGLLLFTRWSNAWGVTNHQCDEKPNWLWSLRWPYSQQWNIPIRVVQLAENTVYAVSLLHILLGILKQELLALVLLLCVNSLNIMWSGNS